MCNTCVVKYYITEDESLAEKRFSKMIYILYVVRIVCMYALQVGKSYTNLTLNHIKSYEMWLLWRGCFDKEV